MIIWSCAIVIVFKIKWLSISDNIASQLGYITSDHFIYKNKTQSVAIKLDKSNVFLFC